MFAYMPQFAHPAKCTYTVCSLNTHIDLDEKGSQVKAQETTDIVRR